MIVTLPRKHTHQGVTYQAGQTIDLPEADIAWLMQAERATRAQLLAQAPVVPVIPEPVAEPEIQTAAE